MRNGSGWRSFHRKKRLAMKLFKQWQEGVKEELLRHFGKAWMALRSEECDYCDYVYPPGTLFFAERASYEYDEWDHFCPACAYARIHEYDDWDACLKEDCMEQICNPVVDKKTGKRKYSACPKCGGRRLVNSVEIGDELAA